MFQKGHKDHNFVLCNGKYNELKSKLLMEELILNENLNSAEHDKQFVEKFKDHAKTMI